MREFTEAVVENLPVLGEITRDHVKRIRKAKYASIQHHEGVTRIQLMLDEKGGGFKWLEPITVKHRVHFGDGRKFDPSLLLANSQLIYMDQPGHARDALLDLWAGDVVEILWEQDQGNGYLKGARTTVKSPEGNYVASNSPLHQDECLLRFDRRGNTYTRMIHTSISPDNTARMIQIDHA